MAPTRGIAPALALALAACTTPQALTVTPQLRVPAADLGGARPVQVSVSDQRASQALADKIGYEPGDYTVRGDFAAIVREALASGLERLGFKVTPDAARELRAEIVGLEYGVRERGGMSRQVEATSRLKAGCLSGGKVELERTHRGEMRKPVFLSAHDEPTNSRYVSEVVSDSINAVLADRELIACLAR
jgi:uncharacterized lipoprotein YajG